MMAYRDVSDGESAGSRGVQGVESGKDVKDQEKASDKIDVQAIQATVQSPLSHQPGSDHLRLQVSSFESMFAKSDKLRHVSKPFKQIEQVEE